MNATEAHDIAKAATDRIGQEQGVRAASIADKWSEHEQRALEAAFMTIRDYAHTGNRSCPVETSPALVDHLLRALSARGYLVDTYERLDTLGIRRITITVRW